MFSAYLVTVEMSGHVNVYMWDDASRFTLQMVSKGTPPNDNHAAVKINPLLLYYFHLLVLGLNSQNLSNADYVCLNDIDRLVLKAVLMDLKKLF